MDISYFKHDGVLGDYFSCPKGLGTYSTNFCARMYAEAMSPEGLKEGLRVTCKSCPIGAKHAGDYDNSTSCFLGKILCSRCQKGANRLIRSSICVSCYNREREVLIGKNAKGTPPIFCKDVGSVYASYAIDSGKTIQVSKINKVTSLMEAYLSILHDASKALWFGMVNPMPIN